MGGPPHRACRLCSTTRDKSFESMAWSWVSTVLPHMETQLPAVMGGVQGKDPRSDPIKRVIRCCTMMSLVCPQSRWAPVLNCCMMDGGSLRERCAVIGLLGMVIILHVRSTEQDLMRDSFLTRHSLPVRYHSSSMNHFRQATIIRPSRLFSDPSWVKKLIISWELFKTMF